MTGPKNLIKFTLEHRHFGSVMEDAQSSKEEGRWGVFPLIPGDKARTRMPARMVGFVDLRTGFDTQKAGRDASPNGTVL